MSKETLSNACNWDSFQEKKIKEFIGKIKCSWNGFRSRTPDMQKVIDAFVKNIEGLAGDKFK